MPFTEDQLLELANWTFEEERAARRYVSMTLNEHVLCNLGPHGSRVGRMQIVLELMAELLVHVSCQDIALLVLEDIMEQVRRGPFWIDESGNS